MGLPKINWYYVLTVIIVAAGSIPKGYDEGGFSSATGLPSFLDDFRLNPEQWTSNPTGLANREANISSFGVLGAAFGAVLALLLADRLGRLRCWQGFMVLWMSGNLLQTFSSGVYGLMLFARLWGGLGAGGLTVVAPLYLSEVAPARTRGMVVSIYMVLLLTFLTIGFFISYAAQKTMPSTPTQYRLVISIVLVPTGLALIGSFFLADTPRWLASRDRMGEAAEVLARLRGGSSGGDGGEDEDEDGGSGGGKLVAAELAELQASLQDKQLVLGGVSTWTIVKEIASVRTYRVRFLLGLTMQTVAQWSGGNGITYYIPEIFRYAGVTGPNTSLITSGAYGVVKLVFTMAFTWGLVDVFGRRWCFSVGLFLQCITHVYMAVYMGLFSSGENKAASDAAIASVFVYAVGWSVGLCTVQYLYGTEIYPTRIRSVCYAANMVTHWFFQFAVVRVTPNMFESLDVWGAYVFWALVCAVGLVILGLWAPETKGVPMEMMEELFAGPWYKTWRAKVDLSTSSSSGGVGVGGEGSVLGDEEESRGSKDGGEKHAAHRVEQL